MTHPTYAKILAVGLLIASLFAPLIWAPRLSAAKAVAPGHKSQKGVNAPAAQDTQTPEEPLDVVLAAPYWSTTDGFVSTIEMKNYHVSNPLTVTPVLHLEQGGDVALDPVALKPSETRRININQALAKRGLCAGATLRRPDLACIMSGDG